MSGTDVLDEILAWSEGRALWQRDALRRLLVAENLSESDISELTELCKQPHGLAEGLVAKPLDKSQLPDQSTKGGRIEIESIYHHCGVNALAERQSLSFGPNLTIVYGDNASGKSGYTRIFKDACRARGAEDILGNVLSESAPAQQVISIRYRVGNDGTSVEWTGKGEDTAIRHVKVFDSHAAAVYLKEKTDVAFRPFGLDLFDKLVRACQDVRSALEKEERLHNTSQTQNLEFPEGTAVAKVVSGISSLTDPEKVRKLAELSDEETAQQALLAKQLVDLQSQDPAKLTKELALRVGRFRTFLARLKELDKTLSDTAVRHLFALQEETRAKAQAVKDLREKTIPSKQVLDGTGIDAWRELWEAARVFSNQRAYRDKDFPVTEDGARCLLCQQPYSDEAAARLRDFEQFIQSAAERDFKKARDAYGAAYKLLDELVIRPETIADTLNEFQVESEELATKLGGSFGQLEERKATVLAALKEKKGHPDDLHSYEICAVAVENLIEQLEQRIVQLGKDAKPDEIAKTKQTLSDLDARLKLVQHLDTVLAEIERKKRLAAYVQCKQDTNFQGITQKSGALTKEVVTKQLQSSFARELGKLNFKHVEVELSEAGGSHGTFYHKVVLKRAPSIEVQKVVSEGEARCLSIAAFFAEQSTADEESTILFDDPVSSLDHKWRTRVAARLVEEASHRQVIVFTHDIVFLLALQQQSELIKIGCVNQHLRNNPASGAGVCSEELPWVAMKVSKKLKTLRKLQQDAVKVFNDGHIDAYEIEARKIYGFLREAWERALEEVLLGGVVERFRNSVQTKQIQSISDIEDMDCEELEVGMTKCSGLLIGHDQAAAANDAVPEPDELLVDINALQGWVDRIRKRRGN